MLPMTSHLFSSGSYRSMVFPISEPIQPPEEEQCNYQLVVTLTGISQNADSSGSTVDPTLATMQSIIFPKTGICPHLSCLQFVRYVFTKCVESSVAGADANATAGIVQRRHSGPLLSHWVVPLRAVKNH